MYTLNADTRLDTIRIDLFRGVVVLVNAIHRGLFYCGRKTTLGELIGLNVTMYVRERVFLCNHSRTLLTSQTHNLNT